MDLDKMTVKELREFAEGQGINLLGRDKKQDIIDTIAESGALLNADDGSDHQKAIEKDRAACLKALGGK